MEALSAAFLSLLRCPVTLLPLTEISVEKAVRCGVPEAEARGWSSGLLRSDGLAVYPVRGGLPVLLAEELRTCACAPEGASP